MAGQPYSALVSNMLEARIHTDTAIEWAKAKAPDELREMVVRWSKPSRKEYWRIGFHSVVILVLLGTIPLSKAHNLHWIFPAGAFLGACVLLLRMLAPIQRDLNGVATAEYALKLQAQLKTSVNAPPKND